MSWSKGEQAQQDLWSALVTVAEADMEDIEYLMVRLQDADLNKIRQAAQAALVASSRLQAAEQEMASGSTTTPSAEAVSQVVATGSTDDSQVAPTAGMATGGTATTVAKPSGAAAGAVSKKASKLASTGPTFAKVTSPGTAAAAKAMTAKPASSSLFLQTKGRKVRLLQDQVPSPPKKQTPVKCPPKEPAPQPAPPGREDAIAMLMAPS